MSPSEYKAMEAEARSIIYKNTLSIDGIKRIKQIKRRHS